MIKNDTLAGSRRRSGCSIFIRGVITLTLFAVVGGIFSPAITAHAAADFTLSTLGPTNLTQGHAIFVNVQASYAEGVTADGRYRASITNLPTGVTAVYPTEYIWRNVFALELKAAPTAPIPPFVITATH